MIIIVYYSSNKIKLFYCIILFVESILLYSNKIKLVISLI